MLFQADIFDIMRILSLIMVFLQVIGFSGLIIVGSSRIRNSSTINKSVIFTIVGVVEILYLTINQRLFLVILGVEGYYTMPLLMLQNALNGMIPNIISLITFGVLFLLLGLKNKQNSGKLLMYSGIFWIVFGVILIVPYSIFLVTYIPLPVPPELFNFARITILIATIFKVTSSIFFVIYASKLRIKILLYSSIFLFVASSVSAVISLVELSLFIL